MICEIYRRRGVRRRGWSFRLLYDDGRIPNHVYRDQVDAARGAHDFLAAMSRGEIMFRIEGEETKP